MTTAADTVDWAALKHAYGPATDTPNLIRDLHSNDHERVTAALNELVGSIHHQGTVYPATVAAVPYLVDAALNARHQRADQVISIGMLADPHHSYGRAFPTVRQAVREHARPLAALLHDEDESVRAAVAYLAAQTGLVPLNQLTELWESAEGTPLRVALLFALAASDPMGGLVSLHAAVFDDEPEVCLAGALALQGAGMAWPDGAAEALVEAFEQEADIPYEWHAHAEPTTELILRAADEDRNDLLGQLLRPESPACETALYVLGELFRARRGPRELFMPLLGPLLADARTCQAAADLLGKAGRASGRYRNELAAIAAGYPNVATARGFTAELSAVRTLVRLGDPRWVAIVCDAARAGHRHIDSHTTPCNAETLATVQARLDALPTDVVTSADRAELHTLRVEFARWGEAAAELVPRLRELVPSYGVDAAHVPAALGDDVATVVGCLRAAAADGNVTEAVSLWRITGEAEPIVAGVRRLLGYVLRGSKVDPPDVRPARNVEPELRQAFPAGPNLRDLADDLRDVATAGRHPLGLRLTAARLLWTATGETDVPTTVLGQSLANRFLVPDALELARLMDARSLKGDILALLNDDDGRAGAAAARTLWAFGMSPDELMPYLHRCIENGSLHPAMEAVDLIVEMGHNAAVPILQELADRDAALVTAGAEFDIVWNDEQLCDRLLAAVACLAHP